MKKILGLCLFGFMVNNAFAVDNCGSKCGGTYIDLNFGILNQSYTNYINTPSSYSGTSSFIGLGLNVGHMFNRFVGVEGGLVYSPISLSSLNSSDISWNASYYAMDLAVKGVLPFSEVFNLYGKLGLSGNWYITSTNGSYLGPNGDTSDYYTAQSASYIGALGAVGAQFNLSRKWSLHLEYNYTYFLNSQTEFGDLTTPQNPSMAMFGVGYKF